MNIDSIFIKGLEVHDNRMIYKNNEILFDNIESITFYAIERETSVLFFAANSQLTSYLVINELNKNKRIKIKSESPFFNRRDTEKKDNRGAKIDI